MKLSLILENRNLASVKNKESDFQNEFLNFVQNKVQPKIFNKEIEALLKLSGASAEDISSAESFGKPSAKRAKYGSSVEPKTDFCLKIGKKFFNVSFKNGNNYIFSAGAPKEFQGICEAALEILSLNYPNRCDELKDDIIDDIEKVISFIGKAKKETYTKLQLKNKKASWFKGIDPDDENENAKFALANQDNAIDAIRKRSEENPNEYKDFLNLAESTVKETLTKMLNGNLCFAKCFFFETYSGIWKFGGDGVKTKDTEISPIANVVVHAEKGVFEIETVESPLIIAATENFGIRLQNVPRGNARRFVSKATEETRNLRFLIDCLNEIELSLKIGADKKQKISEFVEPDVKIGLQKIRKAIHQASLSEILQAFNLQITKDN